jgi:hypothetical protein
MVLIVIIVLVLLALIDGLALWLWLWCCALPWNGIRKELPGGAIRPGARFARHHAHLTNQADASGLAASRSERDVRLLDPIL